MTIYLYKVTILFYMLIVLQEQPEFKHGHNHEHHHKHAHDHDHDHHRRSEIRKASRIYNGQRTPQGQAKFMALIMKRIILHHCSAVIITENMLLTAAHCFDSLSNSELPFTRILPNALPIPTYKINPHRYHPLIKTIKNVWIHPRYRPNSTDDIFDIAIIQIGPQPWPLGNEVDTALMPVRIRQLDWRKIIGYGFGSEVGNIIPDYLNKVYFRYYGNETLCERLFVYRRSNNDHDVNFCVTNWSADRNQNPSIIRNAGPGDSGGGIFIRGSVRRFDRSTNRTKTGLVLAGIIIKNDNYSLSSANRVMPHGTLAVNVTTMMPWINSIVRVNFETYPFPMPNRV